MIVYLLKYDNEVIYVGSTTKSIKERLIGHKSDMKNKNMLLYKFLNDKNICIDDLDYQIIGVGLNQDLRRIEGLYIKNLKPICNKRIEGRDNKDIIEYNSEYNKNNKDKIAEQKKEYRKNNKDEIAEYQSEYYKNNKDKISEYRKNNKDKILEQQSEYYKNNKDKILEQQNEYYKNNKDKISEQKRIYYFIKNLFN